MLPVLFIYFLEGFNVSNLKKKYEKKILYLVNT